MRKYFLPASQFLVCIPAIFVIFKSIVVSSCPKYAAIEKKYAFPGINNEKYAVLGDINLGAFMSVTVYPKGFLCSTNVRSEMWVLQYLEAIAFAVQMVNKNESLLPNISLGFVVVDYCRSPNIALAQALSFLPLKEVIDNTTESTLKNASFSEAYDLAPSLDYQSSIKKELSTTLSQRTLLSLNTSLASSIEDNLKLSLEESTGPPTEDFLTSSTTDSLKSSSKEAASYTTEGFTKSSAIASVPSESFKALPQYDVVGVLGPQGSTSTLPISSLYAVAKIPLVSYMATSDELSSVYVHPYFMRLVPPDKHQTIAMLTFISENRWSYISVVYGDNTYGSEAFDSIRLLSPQFGICIATSHSVDLRTNFDRVLSNLLLHKRARVVILFMDTDPTFLLFAACSRAGIKGQFIWIGSDALSDRAISKGEYLELLQGSFTFMYYSKKVPEFEKYFQKLRPGSTVNPWFNQFWEIHTRCSFNAGTCLTSESIHKFEEVSVPSTVSLVIDSVYTFAHSLHKLLIEICPAVIGKNARRCVDREKLIAYMMNITFDGFTGKISFDGNGDLVGVYEIRQMLWGNDSVVRVNNSGSGTLTEVPVAHFKVRNGKIVYTNQSIRWSHLNVLPRIVPLAVGAQDSGHPESVCSKPCVAGEFMIQKEQECCWECRACRENERLVLNGTACTPCEKFTWPDPVTNFTTCLYIPLSYASISDALSIVEVSLAALAIVGQGLVVASYVYFRKHQAIKAASRELSILQMVAIFAGYITVILFQTKPNDTKCAVIYFMFCLSFTWLYAPLIVKAVRIYRIFQSSSKNNRRPRFISPQSQVVMAGVLIALQICLCMATYIFYQPSAKRTQSIDIEKFVELSCDMTLQGLASFLTYNLFLVTLCSTLAFKTRKLPENFNESRFMSLCVSTTMLIWLAFIPSYFTATREYTRVILLSAALFINHTVALVFLFLPKVYAAACVTQDSLVVTRFHTNVSALTPNIPVVSNRITPLTTSRGVTK